jgi:8-oxo-(d)GTP phosphatase
MPSPDPEHPHGPGHGPGHSGRSGLQGGGSVLAAGAICWRLGPGGGLELLLVHSARWDEWSWPKGKLEPGESLPVCAVREVEEETGVQIELGAPLPSVGYVLPDGRDKMVSYWAGRVRGSGPRTASDAEIADAGWLPVEQALDRLSRPGDLRPLDELLARHARGRLDTRPLLVVRHAKARSRTSWPGREADRPLTTTGEIQAHALAGLLTAWSPPRLLTSPWARCVQTLAPYRDLRHEQGDPVEPELVPLFSEQSHRDEPRRIAKAVTSLLDADAGVLVCTHRPVLASIMGALAAASPATVRDRLPTGDPWLSPAQILVAHVARGTPGEHGHGTGRVSAVERHLARSPRNRAQSTDTPA